MQRSIFEAEHEQFRQSVRGFLERSAKPFTDEWEKAEIVPRSVWEEAGANGFLGMSVPEEFGGGGVEDFRYNVVLGEEVVRAGASGLGFTLHNDVITPYLVDLANDEQKARWLPGFCSGKLITAIAMTEPGTGSDLQGIRTSAVRDGDDWVLNGAKTFITNGINADLVIVVARTDPDAGAGGFSLLVVERGMAGFERGRNLDKIGLKSQDTAELSFDNVRVPAANLLGEEGKGFYYLMRNLPQERLTIAVGAAAVIERVLEMTKDYVNERKAFGKPIAAFQNTRFELAEVYTTSLATRTLVDQSILALNAGELSPVDASAVKLFATERQLDVVNRCLQLFGGYGYMREYPIAKAYLDSRVQTIYGGTSEIMKEIIGRSLSS